MANHRITVELNDETIRCLAAVGKPDEVLARLAHSAADGVRNRHPQRDQTDVSLRIERASTDARETLDSEAIESQAVAQAARETERSAENAELHNVRAARRRSRSDLVAAEREATDLDLTGERANTDTLIVDLREANERMVIATIRADEMTDELRESEERYRTLFDLCPVAVYSCDVTGEILKFNQHAADLWGRAPALRETDERFCGSFKMFRMDGTFMPHDLCLMAEVLSGKLRHVRDAEAIIERPDGSRVTVVVNIRR
ncbi:MAG: PAS domain S-box protein [Myxococcales bacterium]|nr:PAS domain S-box protein [Myxococcales bacterium]